MKLGVSSKIDRTDYQQKYIDKYNLFLEICDFAYPEVLNNDESIKECLKHYRTLFKNKNIYRTLHGPFLGLTVHAVDNDFKKLSMHKIYKALNIANELGCTKAVFHTDFLPIINNENYRENAVDAHSEFWLKASNDFKNITICLENMFEHDHDFIAEVLNNCNQDNLKFCLDIAHAFVFSKISPQTWYQKLNVHFSHLHLSDNNKKVDNHLALGNGKIKNHKFIRKFINQNPDFTAAIEIGTEEELKQSLEYLKKNKIL